MAFSSLKLAIFALLFARSALAAVVITSTITTISLNNAVNITWTGGTSAASGTGVASVILYTHADAAYKMKAVLSIFGKGGTFTWTPSSSNDLTSNVTYTIGVEDSTAEIGYSSDFTLSSVTTSSTSTATSSSPSSTSTGIVFPDDSSTVSRGAMIAYIVVSILVPALIALVIWRWWRARRIEKENVQAIVFELQEQGVGPAMINEVLSRRRETMKAEARAAKIDRKINRRLNRL